MGILEEWCPSGSRNPKISRRSELRRIIEEAMEGTLSEDSEHYGVADRKAFGAILEKSSKITSNDEQMISFIISYGQGLGYGENRIEEQIDGIYQKLPRQVKNQFVSVFHSAADQDEDMWRHKSDISRVKSGLERDYDLRKRFKPSGIEAKKNRREALLNLKDDISTLQERIDETDMQRNFLQNQFFEKFEALITSDAPTLENIKQIGGEILQDELVAEIIRRRSAPSEQVMEDLSAISDMIKELQTKAGSSLKELTERRQKLLEDRIELQKMRMS